MTIRESPPLTRMPCWNSLQNCAGSIAPPSRGTLTSITIWLPPPPASPARYWPALTAPEIPLAILIDAASSCPCMESTPAITPAATIWPCRYMTLLGLKIDSASLKPPSRACPMSDPMFSTSPISDSAPWTRARMAFLPRPNRSLARCDRADMISPGSFPNPVTSRFHRVSATEITSW